MMDANEILTVDNAVCGIEIIRPTHMMQGVYTLRKRGDYGPGGALLARDGDSPWYGINNVGHMIAFGENETTRMDKWVIIPDDEPEPRDVDPLEIAQNAVVMIMGFERLVDEGSSKLAVVNGGTIEDSCMLAQVRDVFRRMKKIIEGAKPESSAAPAHGSVPDLNP
jgi:hypothetical protein